MKNVLIITTVSGFVPQFEMNNVQILQKIGYHVHYASNFRNPHYGFDNHRLEGTGIICHQIDFERSPFHIWENLRAYKQLRILLEEISFDLIHCHTPIGGAIGRIATERFQRKRKRDSREKQKEKRKNRKIKVFYTAHGFHFYRGAPLVNWILYYPVERWLAHYTDTLITINEEDYRRTQQFRLRSGGKVWKINGVGIDGKAYQNVSVLYEKKRKELGISTDAFVFLSVGELTRRKNHQVIIKALASMKEECKWNKVHYLICGEGPKRKKLVQMIRKYHLEQVVTLLGYRNDIKELLAISDCFLFPSKQEGLPVALMEAMAAGKICICSDIRGNRDLVEKSIGSILIQKNKKQFYRIALKKILETKEKQKKIQEKIGEEYQQVQIREQMEKIYRMI